MGFCANFPPLGIELVSWHAAMGIGQIVTLRRHDPLHSDSPGRSGGGFGAAVAGR